MAEIGSRRFIFWLMPKLQGFKINGPVQHTESGARVYGKLPTRVTPLKTLHGNKLYMLRAKEIVVWLKKKKKLTGVEWMAAEFRTSKAAIEGSTLDEMFFAIPLAGIWKRFLDEFKDPAGFTSFSRDQQMSYFRTSLAHLEQMQRHRIRSRPAAKDFHILSGLFDQRQH